jgi:hypothetical protein
VSVEADGVDAVILRQPSRRATGDTLVGKAVAISSHGEDGHLPTATVTSSGCAVMDGAGRMERTAVSLTAEPLAFLTMQRKE